MDKTRIGLASHLTFEEREKVERELGVMLGDLYDAIHSSWQLFRELKDELDTVLYGAPRSL